MQSFNELGLVNQIEEALRSLNFQTPTPIQAKAIPVALKGVDIIGNAQTGTGKTAAFCIPILTTLLQDQEATALILLPTRELVQQVEEFWFKLTKFSKNIRSASLIGGASMKMQFRALSKRPRVIIATPGRLIDHLQRKTASLAKTKILVLDEADRMLDMGFAPQLSEILKFLPQARQTMLFSATWSREIDQLSKKYLKNPQQISIGTVSQAAKTVTQSVLPTTGTGKNDLLLDQLNERQGSVLVFTRTKIRADRVARFLDSYGMIVGRLHGDRTQAQRTAALADFRHGKVRVLVATDIAARGIDVAEIAHVINYDLPQCPEDYVHRIGRTGRAGIEGSALSFVAPEDRGLWRRIAFLLQKTGSAVPEVAGMGGSQRSEKTPRTRTPRVERESSRREGGMSKFRREFRDNNRRDDNRDDRRDNSRDDRREHNREERQDNRRDFKNDRFSDRRRNENRRDGNREGNRENRRDGNREGRRFENRDDRSSSFRDRVRPMKESRFGRSEGPRFKKSPKPWESKKPRTGFSQEIIKLVQD